MLTFIRGPAFNNHPVIITYPCTIFFLMPIRTRGVLVQKGKYSERPYHIYKSVWTPIIREELHTKLEEDNRHDEHAVAVILDGHTVDHLPRTISHVLWFF